MANHCAPFDGDEDDYCGDEDTLHGPDSETGASDGEGCVFEPLAPLNPEDRLAPLRGVRRRKIRGMTVEAGSGEPVRAASSEEIKALIGGIDGAILEFLGVVEAREAALERGEKVGKPVMYVLESNTGSGKSAGFAAALRRFVARNPEAWVSTPSGEGHREGRGRSPILVAAPGYKLLNQLIADLGRPADRDGQPLPNVLIGVYKGTSATGCERDGERRLFEEAGLSATRLCAQTVPDGKGGMMDVVCPFAAGCPSRQRLLKYSSDPWGRGHWQNGRLVPGDCGAGPSQSPVEQILGLPYAFGTLPVLPHALRGARAVFWDENLTSAILRTATFPLSTFVEFNRTVPSTTKAERAAGIGAETLMGEYAGLAKAVHDALLAQEDAAEAAVFHVLGNRAPLLDDAKGHRIDWLAMVPGDYAAVLKAVSVAKRVTRATMQGGGDIDADLTQNPNPEKARRVATGGGSDHVRAEWRAWAIIDDRIDWMRKRAALNRDLEDRLDRIARGADIAPSVIDRMRAELDGPLADPVGHDIRVRLAPNGKDVILGWRGEWSWPTVPTMVFDASANEQTYRALFGHMYDIRFIRLRVVERVRTIAVMGQGNSNSSLLPDTAKHGTKDRHGRDVLKESAKRRLRLKDALEAITHLHRGDSLLLTSTKKVEGMLAEWALGAEFAAQDGKGGDPYAAADASIRMGHFNALRGLDFARDFGALANIGKQELPIEAMLGLAAAMSYDQAPDAMAGMRYRAEDGTEANFRMRVRRRYRTRDGRFVTLDVNTYDDRWMRLIHDQAREQEIYQAAGRLRPVHKLHRGDDPVGWQVAYMLCDCLPEDVVLDDILHIDDLAQFARVVRVAARHGGCISAMAWAASGMVKRQARTRARAERTGVEDEKALLKSARKAMDNFGFSEGREPLAGWAVVRVRRAGVGNPWITVHVDTTRAADPVAAAMEHVRSFGREVTGGELMAATQAPAPTVAEVDREEDTRTPRAERVAEAKEVMADVFATWNGPSHEDFRIAVERVLYQRHRVRAATVAEINSELARIADGTPAPVAGVSLATLVVEVSLARP